MASHSSIRFSLLLTVSLFYFITTCEGNKNIPQPFKGFGYRLFTKHPAPGTNQKGEFNLVHISLPHPQFPIFEPFPDLLTPLFPSIPMNGRPAFGKPGVAQTPISSGGFNGTTSGQNGSGGTTPGRGGDSSTSSEGLDARPESVSDTPTDTDVHTGTTPDEPTEIDMPESEAPNGDGKTPGSNQGGYDSNAENDPGTTTNDDNYPAPEDGVSPAIDSDQESSLVPGTNGPTGDGTNGNGGDGGNAVQIDSNAPICVYGNYSGLHLCTSDPDYPSGQLKAYIQARYSTFVTMYSDVNGLNTANSVDGLKSQVQETYICPSKVRYWKPLRARNSDGLWKIIVNIEQFTQSIRIETCESLGKPCSMIPPCFPTSCVQKHVYQRLLTFDPWNHYYPFKIDIFKLPSSCSCLINSSKYGP